MWQLIVSAFGTFGLSAPQDPCYHRRGLLQPRTRLERVAQPLAQSLAALWRIGLLQRHPSQAVCVEKRL